MRLIFLVVIICSYNFLYSQILLSSESNIIITDSRDLGLDAKPYFDREVSLKYLFSNDYHIGLSGSFGTITTRFQDDAFLVPNFYYTIFLSSGARVENGLSRLIFDIGLFGKFYEEQELDWNFQQGGRAGISTSFFYDFQIKKNVFIGLQYASSIEALTFGKEAIANTRINSQGFGFVLGVDISQLYKNRKTSKKAKKKNRK